jgi:hypothetical protein
MTKQLAMPTEKIVWTVDDLIKLNQKKKLFINKEYQRSEVWKKPKKQLLIDSLLNDYDIGSIILRQKDNRWEILDGQQRLKTIFDFINGSFPLPDEAEDGMGGKYWKQLGKNVQWGQLMVRKVYTTKIYSLDDETTSRIFLRVQEGMPLNAAEKLNAMRGKIRNTIMTLSEHPFLKQTSLSQFRFAFRYLCAQIILQEIDNGILNHNFKDAKFVQLKKMYEDYRDTLPSNIQTRFTSIMNFMLKGLGNKAKTIRQKSDLLSIYALASYIFQNYSTKDKEETLGNFVVEFLSNVESSNIADREGYYDYWVARTSTPDSKKQIEKRFQIILEKFLTYNPNMKLKDKKRDFDWGQKLAIYAIALKKARMHRKKEAVCKICGKSTPFSKGEPDHIKSHNRSGPTTVENGQWTCRTCNRRKRDTK